MGLILLIIFIIVVLIVLLFLFALKIRLVLNTDNSEISVTVLWLYPFIRAFVSIENATPILKIYLFKKQILKRAIKGVINRVKKKHGGMELIKISDPKDIHVNVNYGFSDPFTTGIACGVINMASQLINIDSINQTPDFMSSNDYIYLDATAKVNLGSTLFQFLSQKSRI